MPKYRSFPTELLENPDVIEAGSDVQAVLFLLGLSVDDEGRGIAHSGMLARKFNKDIEVIDRTLTILVACELIVLYQVGRHRYFQICQWHRWQSLSKKTPSKYPSPPDDVLSKESQETPENPGKPREISAQEKGKRKEQEENQTEGEDEEERANDAPDNVVTFPVCRLGDTTVTAEQNTDYQGTLQSQCIMQEVAAILHLPVDAALVRIVQDYQHDPLLHLLGEADSAREYIDDPQRNRKSQRMTPAFFRRWLRREHEDAELRRSQRHTTAATGMKGSATSSAPPGAAQPLLSRSLMHLADEIPPGYLSYAKGG
jgi:hypothetical protein